MISSQGTDGSQSSLHRDDSAPGTEYMIHSQHDNQRNKKPTKSIQRHHASIPNTLARSSGLQHSSNRHPRARARNNKLSLSTPPYITYSEQIELGITPLTNGEYTRANSSTASFDKSEGLTQSPLPHRMAFSQKFFILEYESDRADNFSLLRHLLKNKLIVLGVVLTKDVELKTWMF